MVQLVNVYRGKWFPSINECFQPQAQHSVCPSRDVPARYKGQTSHTQPQQTESPAEVSATLAH